jgi:hypothetical protein
LFEALWKGEKGSGGNDDREQRTLAGTEEQSPATNVEGVGVPVTEDGRRITFCGGVEVGLEALQEGLGATNGEHPRSLAKARHGNQATMSGSRDVSVDAMKPAAAGQKSSLRASVSAS